MPVGALSTACGVMPLSHLKHQIAWVRDIARTGICALGSSSIAILFAALLLRCRREGFSPRERAR